MTGAPVAPRTPPSGGWRGSAGLLGLLAATVVLTPLACGRNDIIDAVGDGGSDTWSEDETTNGTTDIGPTCGDGILDSGEECDEGNANGQGGDCTSECTLNFCGDGYVGPFESCDDGGKTENCNEFCQFPSCGDGVLDFFEECDEGFNNGQPGSGCTFACLFNVCGDGHIGPFEGCDDGFSNGNGGPCKLDCQLNFCGDLYVGPGESCDEGIPTPTCNEFCSLVSCGDGIQDVGEECDEGVLNGQPGSDCTNACTLDVCGDDHLGPDEECDDGNLNGTGGECRGDCVLNTCPDNYVGPGEECDEGGATQTCTAACTLPECGDGVQDLGEECDDGNPDNTDDCTTLCKLPVCGDGFLHAGSAEECDDGNLTPGDGCHSDCIPSGTPYWLSIWDQEGRNDIAYDVETDAQGNGYVVGRVVLLAPFEHAEAFLRKYDTNGNLLWERRYWGGFQNSFAYGLGLDPSGLPIITGRIQVNGQGGNVFVRKYDSDGNLVWQNEWNGVGVSASTDFGRDVAVDGSGNAYVAGETTVDGQNVNAWMRRYDQSGAVVWTQTFNNAGNSVDRARGVAVLANGQVVFTGESWENGQAENIWVRRVNPATGASVAQFTINNEDSIDIGRRVIATSDGGYVVAGTIWASGQNQNVWVRRFDSMNATVWTHVWNNAPSNSEDSANAVDVTANGDVVIVGHGFDVVTNRDVLVRRLAGADGTERWTTLTDYFGFSDIGQGIDVDINGDLWICGEREITATNGNDLWVAKIRP